MHPSATPIASINTQSYTVRHEGHMANDMSNTSGPEPAAVLAASTDEIWIKGPLGDHHIPRSAVKKIGRGGMYPWFFTSVRVQHTVPNIPEGLQFKALNARSRDIIAELKALGYPAA